MRPNASSAAILVAFAICASCDHPAIDPSQSLVGVKSLPSARELSLETIQIIPGTSVWISSPRLAYELKPDNSLTVTLTHWDRASPEHEITDAKETFDLPATVASDARHLLRRLRPEPLQGVEYLIRPAGCPPPPTDISSEYSVAFIAEGPKPGVDDDRVGRFDLSPSQYCGTKSAAEARQVIHQVLELFPKSNVAADFENMQNNRDQVIVPL
jgi:hypothetical protein